MSELRKLARSEPEAFESVARARDDNLKELMLRILEEENRNRKPKYEGYVYVVQSDNGLVKIGYSTKPEKRLEGLKTSNPYELELVKSVWFENARAIERQFQEDYEEYNLNGEWFDLDGEQRAELLDRLESLRGIDDAQ